MSLLSWLDKVATDPDYFTDRDAIIAFTSFWLGMIVMGVAWGVFG